MRMLCAMHKGVPYGHLTINGRLPTTRQIAAMASASEKETAKLLKELEDGGIFSRGENGSIYSRRMVRDKAVSDKAAEDGKRGGNPSLKQKIELPLSRGVNPPPYALEAESEAESESKNSPIGESSERLPSDPPVNAGLFGDDASVPPRPKAPRIDVGAVVDVWNEVCGASISRAMRLRPDRLKVISKRFAEDFDSDIGKWRAFCERAAAAPWLRGENDRGWRASLDWCLVPANIVKIDEGYFSRHAPAAPARDPNVFREAVGTI
jgi:hypothetical protein